MKNIYFESIELQEFLYRSIDMNIMFYNMSKFSLFLGMNPFNAGIAGQESDIRHNIFIKLFRL